MMYDAVERYEDYKDSEIEWIGEIPAYWKVKRVKEIGSVVLGKMLDNTAAESKFYRSYLKSKNIGWLKVDVTSVEKMYFSSYELKRYRLNKGDILLSEGGEVGKTSLWEEDLDECYIQNSVHKVTVSKENYSRYFLYQSFVLGHIKYYDSIVNQVSIKHLTKEKLSRVIWLCPPLPEQKAIADYLDTKTAQIDRKIDLLTQKAEKYGQLKQSLINETVTRGLDKSVPMKDSGVEWIGEIPRHWEVKRLAAIGTFSKGGGFSRSDLMEEGQTAILYGDIYTKYELSIEKGERKISVEVSKKSTKIRRGDLLLTGSGETREDIGKCVVYNNDEIAFAGGDVIIFRQPENSSKFLSYFLNMEGVKHEKARIAKGEISVHIYASKLRRILVSLPPLPEQKAIADYLDTKTAQIDRIIKTIHTEIEKLKELRKTLINDVVTGKIKIIENG